MNLRHLTDKALLTDTKKLVRNEREVTTQVLHHLKEIESRKVYCTLKYTSLFDYCVRELGYSEAGAQRRIEASRLMKDLPQIEAKINDGALNLTNLSKAALFFKENNIKDQSTKEEILSSVENLTTRECERKLESLSPSSNEKKVRLSILEKTYADLLRIRSLMGRSFSIDMLLEILIENTKVKIEKDKFKQNQKVRKTPAPEAGRVISAAVKREVFSRDQKCVNCGSTHNLNYDHRIPVSLGGKSDEQNIRLLCFNCNQRSRIEAKL